MAVDGKSGYTLLVYAQQLHRIVSERIISPVNTERSVYISGSMYSPGWAMAAEGRSKSIKSNTRLISRFLRHADILRTGLGTNL